MGQIPDNIAIEQKILRSKAVKGKMNQGGIFDQMSIFPLKYKPGYEVKSGVVVEKGVSIITVLKTIYKESKIDFVIDPALASGRRFAVPTIYDPAVVESFVASADFVSKFRSNLLSVYNDQVKHAEKFAAVPVKHDDDRNTNVFDDDPQKLIDMLNDRSVDDKYLSMDAGAYSSELDIGSKWSMNRTVLEGWFLLDYSGNDSPVHHDTHKALAVYKKYVHALCKTERFRSKLKHALNSFFLPSFKALGPEIRYSSDQRDKKGVRFNLQKFRLTMARVGETLKHGNLDKYRQFRKDMIDPTTNERLPPYIREHLIVMYHSLRLAAGYKWAANYRRSEGGFLLEGSLKGVEKPRAVSIAGKPLNSMIVELSLFGQTVKECTPYLDQKPAYKSQFLSVLREASKQHNIIAGEGDYNAFDQYVQVMSIYEILKIWRDEFATLLTTLGIKYELNLTAQMELIMSTFLECTYVMPSGSSSSTAGLTVITPKIVGLNSGILPTNVIGSGYNTVIQIECELARGKKEDDILSYLLTDVTKKKNLFPLFVLSSDDLAHYELDRASMSDWIKSYVEVSARHKLIVKAYLGDRFLMRHQAGGRDLPMLNRIIQNTLSPETPVANEYKFELGVLARTEGLMGIKAYDVFGTGENIALSADELKQHVLTVEVLLNFCKTAAHPVKSVIDYFSMLLDLAQKHEMFNAKGNLQSKKAAATNYDAKNVIHYKRFRTAVLSRMLQVEDMAEYIADKHSPSTQTMLDSLAAYDSGFAKMLSEAEKQQHQEYLADVAALKIPRIFM